MYSPSRTQIFFRSQLACALVSFLLSFWATIQNPLADMSLPSIWWGFVWVWVWTASIHLVSILFLFFPIILPLINTKVCQFSFRIMWLTCLGALLGICICAGYAVADGESHYSAVVRLFPFGVIYGGVHGLMFALLYPSKSKQNKKFTNSRVEKKRETGAGSDH